MLVMYATLITAYPSRDQRARPFMTTTQTASGAVCVVRERVVYFICFNFNARSVRTPTKRPFVAMDRERAHTAK